MIRRYDYINSLPGRYVKNFLLRGMVEMKNITKSSFGRNKRDMQESAVHFIGKVNNSF